VTTTLIEKTSPKDPTQAAVSLFWRDRADQASALLDAGKSGGEARAARHLSGIRDLVAAVFVEAGMPEETIIHEPYLPGYYRARKRWDMAVYHKNSLVAALEFKSQAGSVRKNQNNRLEEALGAGTDIWAAQHKNRTFGEIPPWLGYVFVLREDNETERKSANMSALFDIDPVFHGLSPSERYRVMLGRFMGDNIYQAGWFITTKQDESGLISYAEPLPTASGKAFRAAVRGRVGYVRSVLDQEF
jgi:hypothetical protein